MSKKQKQEISEQQMQEFFESRPILRFTEEFQKDLNSRIQIDNMSEKDAVISSLSVLNAKSMVSKLTYEELALFDDFWTAKYGARKDIQRAVRQNWPDKPRVLRLIEEASESDEVILCIGEFYALSVEAKKSICAFMNDISELESIKITCFEKDKMQKCIISSADYPGEYYEYWLLTVRAMSVMALQSHGYLMVESNYQGNVYTYLVQSSGVILSTIPSADGDTFIEKNIGIDEMLPNRIFVDSLSNMPIPHRIGVMA